MELIYSKADAAIYQDANNTRAHFASVDAFIDYAGYRKFSYVYDRDTQWTYNTDGKTLAEQIEKREANPDILARLNANLELPTDMNLDAQHASTPQVVLDETGFLCDTTAFYADEDDCMINMVDMPVESKTVHLGISIISGGSVQAELMLNRGVAIVRAVKTLQRMGYSVGLSAYFVGENSNRTNVVDIAIKQPDEPLNENLIASTLAHPSFFRTLGHNAVARFNNDDSGSMTSEQLPEDAFTRSTANSVQVLTGDWNYNDATTSEIAEEWAVKQLQNLQTEGE